MLADTVELVIGVDTHKHTHTAAVVAAATGVVVTSNSQDLWVGVSCDLLIAS